MLELREDGLYFSYDEYINDRDLHAFNDAIYYAWINGGRFGGDATECVEQHVTNSIYRIRTKLLDYAPMPEGLKARLKPSTPEEPMNESLRAGFAKQLLLGADPEFVVLEDGVPTAVSNIIPHAGTVGYDHSGWVLELRPAPQASAWELRQHIARLLASTRLKKLEGKKWRAGAYCNGRPPERPHITLGGHIHFGHLPNMVEAQDAKTGKYWRSPYLEPKTCIGTLSLLTSRLEELDILPTRECAARRNTGNYGKLTDYRGGDDGTHHWEYRAMASWLYHPDNTFICLALGKLAVLHPKTVAAKLQEQAGRAGLTAVLEAFKRDVDAQRALETMDLSKLVHDPDREIREAWRVEIARASKAGGKPMPLPE